MNATNLIALVTAGVLFFTSCENDCKKAGNIYRPPFTEDQLKWVKVADTLPRFKVTAKDVYGNIHVDTLQGSNTYSFEDKSGLSDDECSVIYYHLATGGFYIPREGGGFYGAALELNNYYGNGFEGRILGRNDKFTESTKLDTAFVNGKLYHDVYKLPESASSFRYYYAKGIGFIYVKETEIIELIP